MKKPAWRCLANPTNFVATFRFTDSKYDRVMCKVCKGAGRRYFKDWHTGGTEIGVCIYCKGIGKISLRVGV